jgi:hypothetical protein
VVDNSAEGDTWVYEGGRKRCLKKTVLFVKYYSDSESRGHDMGGTCSSNTNKDKCVLVEKPTGNRSIGKPGRRLEDNIKMNL